MDPVIVSRSEQAKKNAWALNVDDIADIQGDNDLVNRLTKGMTIWTE